MLDVSARVDGLVVPPFDELNQKAAALRRQGHAVISLGQAVPGFDPPASAIEAARRALAEPATHRYSADAGLPSLREALCQAFEREHAIDVRGVASFRRIGTASPGSHVATQVRLDRPCEA